MRTRVKICGIKKQQDLNASIKAGADALGFMFYAPSVRSITIEESIPLIKQVGPYAASVAVFVNPDQQTVEQVLKDTVIDRLQFHGSETVEFCEQFDRPYYKAINVNQDTDLAAISEQYASALGFLLDAHDPALLGGTGKTFDWSLIKQMNRPIILAGGLNCGNIAKAIEQVRPYAVDVSSGVEQKKGEKSPELIEQFIMTVNKTISN